VYTSDNAALFSYRAARAESRQRYAGRFGRFVKAKASSAIRFMCRRYAIKNHSSTGLSAARLPEQLKAEDTGEEQLTCYKKH
jgi:hypothetical protein